MSNWIRKAEDTIRVEDLSISRDEAHGAYLIYAPWDPNLYVTYIAGNKIGYAPRYLLKRSLTKLMEAYPEGFPRDAIETEPIQKVDEPLVMRLGCYIVNKLKEKNKAIDKVTDERKKWMPFEPEPRGWEDGSGTTTEKAIKSINRPEENFESSSL
jgi:hypothetical protein